MCVSQLQAPKETSLLLPSTLPAAHSCPQPKTLHPQVQSKSWEIIQQKQARAFSAQTHQHSTRCAAAYNHCSGEPPWLSTCGGPWTRVRACCCGLIVGINRAPSHSLPCTAKEIVAPFKSRKTKSCPSLTFPCANSKSSVTAEAYHRRGSQKRRARCRQNSGESDRDLLCYAHQVWSTLR